MLFVALILVLYSKTAVFAQEKSQICSSAQENKEFEKYQTNSSVVFNKIFKKISIKETGKLVFIIDIKTNGEFNDPFVIESTYTNNINNIILNAVQQHGRLKSLPCSKKKLKMKFTLISGEKIQNFVLPRF